MQNKVLVFPLCEIMNMNTNVDIDNTETFKKPNKAIIPVQVQDEEGFLNVYLMHIVTYKNKSKDEIINDAVKYYNMFHQDFETFKNVMEKNSYFLFFEEVPFFDFSDMFYI